MVSEIDVRPAVIVDENIAMVNMNYSSDGTIIAANGTKVYYTEGATAALGAIANRHPGYAWIGCYGLQYRVLSTGDYSAVIFERNAQTEHSDDTTVIKKITARNTSDTAVKRSFFSKDNRYYERLFGSCVYIRSDLL